ncbi:MAG: ABC-F family ATP-binding cassette domain-containing protein [Trichlorobacter sp.]|uniref:ABC-F family ATP-binding cassette domain-containing protein n=1 Tax=Trichlorobacter sp. TaxID=2911007 RepID=UPI002565CF6A|nr:ABC-F family ATP-binding cassette domain-containing protein [Trichlorobacter sp.]MDK9716373.1 ABC-F family ATP-binding cassette domain-containing protein [Trichlorobacter sp.]
MLQLVNLSKDYAGRVLFANISWHLRKGERVALIGENGAGKSTLMKIIAGLEESSSGDIQLAKGAKAAYLPQDGIVTSGRKLFHEARSALSELLALEEELHRLGQELEQLPHDGSEHDNLLHRYGELQEQFRHRGGYTMEAEIGTVLKGLGFSQEDWHKDCGQFSGGWQMRIALARLLLQKPDVLLLDEPTNHLDIEARNWLEQYLCSYPGSVILVSHDRFFMDQVCSRIAEVWNHTIADYHCSYSTYLVQREERVVALREAKRLQDEEVQKTEDFIKRFRYQANKASLVQSRIKQLEKVERIELPPERKKIRFQFPDAPKSGRIVLELQGLTRSYGSNVVLNKVDLTVEKGERLALVGHNGAGKSTLMAVLAGGEYQGGSLKLGHNVVADYFAQDQANVLDATRTAYDELYSDCPYEMVPRLRDILGAFLFSGDDIHKKVGVLSGGERNRLALAKMLLRPSNLLLMDEPTNHLDLFSKEVLLDALKGFDGTVVFVSHDRYFVNGLATRIVEVGEGALTDYYGDYEYYLSKKESEAVQPTLTSVRQARPAADTTANGSPEALPPQNKDERVKDREEQKRRKREEQAREKQQQTIEKEIAAVELQIATLEVEMNSPGFFDNPEQGLAAGEQHTALNTKLEELYQLWESCT